MHSLNQKIYLAKRANEDYLTLSLAEAVDIQRRWSALDCKIYYCMSKMNSDQLAAFTKEFFPEEL